MKTLPEVSTYHESFEIRVSRLHVHPSYPCLCASPDRIVSYVCCGTGLVEIKCPYSKRGIDPNLIDEPQFYLIRAIDQRLTLSVKHNYYFQVQGQLFLCDFAYCDFVCWTPKGMLIQRILQDPLVFLEIVPKLERFFLCCIVPRICKARQGVTSCKEMVAKQSDKEDLYCFCRNGENGQMIACDNKGCPYEWFHFECLDLVVEPEGDWYCPFCTD